MPTQLKQSSQNQIGQNEKNIDKTLEDLTKYLQDHPGDVETGKAPSGPGKNTNKALSVGASGPLQTQLDDLVARQINKNNANINKSLNVLVHGLQMQPTFKIKSSNPSSGSRDPLKTLPIVVQPGLGPLAPKVGAAYRDSQIVSYSHYLDDIVSSPGRVSGRSRRWGDASTETQQASVNSLIAASRDKGLTTRETALVLAIAGIESGYNPDAAAGTTSASGLGQFTDQTGKAYGLNKSNRWDVNAQANALVAHFLDNKRLADSRGQGEEFIYKYYHDGPSLDYGGLAISRSEVIPLANEIYLWLQSRK